MGTRRSRRRGRDYTVAQPSRRHEPFPSLRSPFAIPFAGVSCRPQTTDPLLHEPRWRAHRVCDVRPEVRRSSKRRTGSAISSSTSRAPSGSTSLQELSREHTLVRYDERGCGLSDWDVELSFEAWVRDLESRRRRVGRRPLSAARHLAGRVDRRRLRGAPSRARDAPDPARRLRARAAEMGTAPARSARRRKMMTRLAEIGWGQENPAFRQFFTTQFIPDGTPEQHQWFNELERISTSPVNAGRFMRVFSEIDVEALLPKVACPTLVFHCVHDARVPFDEGRLIAGRHPRRAFRAARKQQSSAARERAGLGRWRRRARVVPSARRRRSKAHSRT